MTTKQGQEAGAAGGRRGQGRAATDEDRDVDAEREVLTALAQLDLEAAAAYETAAENAEDARLRGLLLGFARDHRRHVSDLEQLLLARGGAPVARFAERPLLAPLAGIASSLGEDLGVVALIGNEQLTNATYAVAQEMELDDETTAVIQRNAADEGRHLATLRDLEEELSSPGGYAGAADAPDAGRL